MRILFVGYAVIDIIDHRQFLGGAGGSMSLNAAKLGVESSFFGPLSEDTFGRLFQNTFQHAGVNFSLCDRKSPTIPTCKIVDPFGHGSTRLWEDHGALEHFRHMIVSPEKLRDFDRIFLCNAPPEVGEMIADQVQDRVLLYIPGPKSVTIANWVREKILRKTEIAFVNAEEAPVLWKADPFQQGVHIVVNTKGAKGGTVYMRDGQKHSYRPSQTKAVADTTGAGDAWSLGFATEWLRSKDISQAIRVGKKLALQSIQKKGGLLT